MTKRSACRCLRRGGRRGAFEAAPSSSRWGLALCLWCLNPAVVFRSLSEVARSVLLTSGTLSPLDSFSGELGLNFHIKLEAPHVVDMHKQVSAQERSCDTQAQMH